MINTAAEALVDLTSSSCHPLARLIKHIAAGAVLLAAVSAVLGGVTIFTAQYYQYYIKEIISQIF